MATPLNILIVEDSPDDADMVVAELRRAGFAPKWKRVETELDFLAEIKNSPDIILSDYSMPQFNGLRAAELLRKYEWDIPFILISGAVGEETAVEAMKRGAADYLLKDRLARLGQALEHALEQKRLREDHKRMQKQLVLQATALETAANAVIITNHNGTILWVNPAFTTSTGYTLDEAVGKTPSLLKYGKQDQAFYDEFWKTILSGETWRGEFINRRKDGGLYYDELTVTSVRSAEGVITHFIGIMHDVTEHKQAEQALRESEEKFRQLAENINEVFWITDPATQQMLYLSPAYEKIWGRTCNSLYQSPQSWFEVIHRDDRKRILEATRTKQERGEYDETYRITRPDGSVRWIHDRAFPIRNAAGEVYRVVGTAEDITENRKLEEQFRQAQKMEAIGQLAGGVAHDFNNLFTVILCNTEMLLTEEKMEPDRVDALKDVVKASKAAAQLTRQLLVFSRKQTMQSQVFNLNEVVSNLIKMLRRVIGEHIELKWRPATSLPQMEGDPGMLEQVLLNLAVNARDAMPKGGELLVQTEAVTLTSDQAKSHPDARPGEFVRLTVRDTGCGIPPEILPRIFEPFFSTKEAGQGTGLGLATVFGIVKQHLGWVEVGSKMDGGTSFKVYLGGCSRSKASADSQALLPLIRGGTESILVVEDEPSLRSLARRLLQRLGYTVFEAASGVEALSVWKEQAGNIDLLLTD